VQYEPSVSPESDCPVIVLVSGQTLKIRRVKLFEADKVKEISLLKATAAQKFSGVSTGIGFWGSPSWVLEGAVALGIVEGILSSASRKQGLELLKKVEVQFHEMTAGALYFSAEKLMNAHVPYPQAWSAVGTAIRYVDLSKLNWITRKNLLRQHHKDESDVENIDGSPCLVLRKEQTRYVHNGDEFVDIDAGIGTISIRWSHVVAYYPPQQTV
jgi:hypothetical protein